MKLNIKRAIQDRGLKLGDVAKKLGISHVALYQQIHGNPTVETLEKIANTIGCDITELFEPSYKEKTDEQHINKCGEPLYSDTKNEQTIKCPHCGRDLHIKLE